MPRLFAAIELAPSHEATLRRLQRNLDGARWTRHLHLTVVYFGAVDDHTAIALERRLASLDTARFEIEFGRAGFFGPDVAPEVAWMGVEPSIPLAGLHHQVARLAETLGIELDPRPYRPHVTLTRFRRADAAAVAGFVARANRCSLPPLDVDELVLFESPARPETSGYTVRGRYRLAPSL